MITYKNGDLLESDCTMIVHQVNCQGVMGSGIAKQIREKFPYAYERYMLRHKQKQQELGKIDCCLCGDKMIVNFYSQYNYLPRGIRHTDYDAFRKCIRSLKVQLSLAGATPKSFKIGFPYKIGCGLGGGDWDIIEGIIKDEFDSEWEVEIWKL